MTGRALSSKYDVKAECIVIGDNSELTETIEPWNELGHCTCMCHKKMLFCLYLAGLVKKIYTDRWMVDLGSVFYYSWAISNPGSAAASVKNEIYNISRNECTE